MGFHMFVGGTLLTMICTWCATCSRTNCLAFDLSSRWRFQADGRTTVVCTGCHCHKHGGPSRTKPTSCVAYRTAVNREMISIPAPFRNSSNHSWNRACVVVVVSPLFRMARFLRPRLVARRVEMDPDLYTTDPVRSMKKHVVDPSSRLPKSDTETTISCATNYGKRTMDTHQNHDTQPRERMKTRYERNIVGAPQPTIDNGVHCAVSPEAMSVDTSSHRMTLKSKRVSEAAILQTDKPLLHQWRGELWCSPSQQMSVTGTRQKMALHTHKFHEPIRPSMGTWENRRLVVQRDWKKRREDSLTGCYHPEKRATSRIFASAYHDR